MQIIFPDLIEPEIFKANITSGKINHFICYLPLPNDRIKLGDYILDGKEDPRGEDILTCLDKDDLDAEVEALEHDAPDSTPEEFWEAYDLCKVDPYRLEWELLSPEASIYDFNMRRKMREHMFETFYA